MEEVCTQAGVNKPPWSPLSWDKFELDTLVRTEENISEKSSKNQHVEPQSVPLTLK